MHGVRQRLRERLVRWRVPQRARERQVRDVDGAGIQLERSEQRTTER